MPFKARTFSSKAKRQPEIQRLLLREGGSLPSQDKRRSFYFAPKQLQKPAKAISSHLDFPIDLGESSCESPASASAPAAFESYAVNSIEEGVPSQEQIHIPIPHIPPREPDIECLIEQGSGGPPQQNSANPLAPVVATSTVNRLALVCCCVGMAPVLNQNIQRFCVTSKRCAMRGCETKVCTSF